MSTERKVYSVSEITRSIRSVLEGEFGSIWIEGEVSNLRRPGSGHLYFTLKDEGAQISAVLFRGNQRGLAFDPTDGTLVRAFGEIGVYERSGQYQIVVRKLEQGGKGSLQARFEALKDKLLKEGLFDPARKRALPLLPRHVGIVTSATGAAIRDILHVVDRRFPNLHVVIAPVRVQGEGAAAEIASGIEALNRYGGLDVLIVGRGGGSLEDLWCFNEEVVARAIAASRIPVISAVGHEIDFTIGDFVADLRAPTPSAAAEVVVGRKEDFERALREQRRLLGRLLLEQVLKARSRLLALAGSAALREPAALVRQETQRIDTLALRMERALTLGVRESRRRLDEQRKLMERELILGVRDGGRSIDERRQAMTRAMLLQVRDAGQALRQAASQLRVLGPLAVLGRGYSITMDADGRVVASVDRVQAGVRVRTRVADGEFESEVCHSGTTRPIEEGA